VDGKVSGKWEFGRGDEQAKRQLALAVSQLLRPPGGRQTTATRDTDYAETGA
jgi:hypothetical protein